MYVLMGWSVIIALPYLWKMLPADGLMLLVSGGLAYTIGIFSMLIKNINLCIQYGIYL